MPSILDKRTGKRYEIEWNGLTPPSKEVMQQLINEQQEPDHTPDLKTAWERLNTSIFPALTEGYDDAVARNIEGNPEDGSASETFVRSLAADAFRGASGLAEGMTSPLGLVATLSGMGPATKGLKALEVASSAPFAAEGLKNMYEGEGIGAKILGGLQAAGGAIGMRQGFKRSMPVAHSAEELEFIRKQLTPDVPPDIPNIEPYVPAPVLQNQLGELDARMAEGILPSQRPVRIPEQPILGSRGNIQSRVPVGRNIISPAGEVGSIEPVRQFDEPLILTPESAARNVDPLSGMPMKQPVEIVAPGEIRFSDLLRDTANKEKQGRIARNKAGQFYIKPRQGERGQFVGNKPFTVQDMLNEWEKESIANLKNLATGSNPQDISIVFGQTVKNIAKLMTARSAKSGIKGVASYDKWKASLPQEFQNVDDTILRSAYGLTSSPKLESNPISSISKMNDDIDNAKLPEPIDHTPTDMTDKTGWVHKAAEIAGVPRTLITAWDLSFPGRQGAFLALRHPVMAKNSFVDMVKSLKSDDAATALYNKVMQRENGRPSIITNEMGATKIGPSMYQQVGLEITSREEAFPSELAFKIPGIGTAAKKSSQAYSTAAIRLRADRYDDIHDRLIRAGFDPASDITPFKKAAEYVNTATGRTSLGRRGDKAAELLSTIMFAPRYAASRVVLLNPRYYAKLPPVVRAEAAKDAAAFYGAVIGVLTLAKQSEAFGGPKVEVEIDPRSSDFGKIKIGDTRIDVGVGFPQWITFATRAWPEMLGGSGKVKYGNRLVKIEDTAMKDKAGLYSRFARSKASPFAGSLATMTSDKFYEGTPFNSKEISSWAKLGGENITPIFFQDVKEVYDNDPKMLPLLAPLAFFGVGVSSYKAGKEKKKSEWMRNLDKAFDENVVDPISDKF